MTFNKKWQSLQTFPSLKKCSRFIFFFFLHNVDSLECCCKKLFFCWRKFETKTEEDKKLAENNEREKFEDKEEEEG